MDKDFELLLEEDILQPLYVLIMNLNYLIGKLEYLRDNKHYKDPISNIVFISNRVNGLVSVGFFNGEELRDSKDFIDNFLQSFVIQNDTTKLKNFDLNRDI